VRESRGVALGVVVAALTGLLVIYESAPGPGAGHGANGWLVLVCIVIGAVALVWAMFGRHIGRWASNQYGIPYPIASVAVDGSTATLRLSRLARIEEWFDCLVVLPDKSHVETSEIKKMNADYRDVIFPSEFGPVLTGQPPPGKYRVVWRPLRRQPGSSVYADPSSFIRSSFKLE
jgi:hypothetical protein